jgi:hypothetical protein
MLGRRLGQEGGRLGSALAWPVGRSALFFLILKQFSFIIYWLF